MNPRDLAVAKAVRDACLEIQENLTENERLHRVAPSRHMGYRAENGAELIRDLDLIEIIKGVK